eukprot:TRINITY_DN10771_c0_g1_i1.p1 TRINITY_DN10771_c0_g1~~TRINITY_DN10771_c0_g1_i1.p1  ORF type:complete len:278 (+),score=75.87 TRINITY_DN10771_c0_g1_i1:169-1002(+)
MLRAAARAFNMFSSRPAVGSVSESEKKGGIFSTTLEMREIPVNCAHPGVKTMQFGVMGLTEAVRQQPSAPCILAISGEAQQHVSRFFQSWKPEERGWVVVTPLRPSCLGLFMDDPKALALIPQLLDHIRTLVGVEGNRFHVIGTSNGGTTALNYGVNHTEDCLSISVVTGSLSKHSRDLHKLKDLPVDVHCGEQDELGFLQAAYGIESALQAVQHKRTSLMLYPEAGHFSIGEHIDKKQFWKRLESYRPAQPAASGAAEGVQDPPQDPEVEQQPPPQ